MAFLGDLGKYLGAAGGGIGGFLLGGPVGALGGAKLGYTAGQGKKGKWGLDELLAGIGLGGASGVPGLDKLPFMGGGDPTNGGLGSMAGEMSSTGQSLGGGTIRDILGKVGKTMKDNPLETAMIAGSIWSGLQGRKQSDAERALTEAYLEKQRRRNEMASMAQVALQRMLAQGPYSRSMPNMSDIFGGTR